MKVLPFSLCEKLCEVSEFWRKIGSRSFEFFEIAPFEARKNAKLLEKRL